MTLQYVPQVMAPPVYKKWQEKEIKFKKSERFGVKDFIE